MTELIARFVQGIAVCYLASGILRCIRKNVAEHKLPRENAQQFYIFLFISGFCFYPDKWIISTIMILFIACLGAMAYTDFYTRQIYVFFYVIVALIGYGQMAFCQDWRSMGSILIFILVVLAGKLFKAYTIGDAEMLIAAAPYISLIAERNAVDGLLLLFVYYWLGMFFWMINWLLYMLVKRIWKMKFPMVPFMYAALITILCLENFL